MTRIFLREPWAWLSCALILERDYHAEARWRANPFTGEEDLRVVSDLYDVVFWPQPMAATHWGTKP